MRQITSFLLILLLFISHGFAQHGSKVINLNTGWQFYKAGSKIRSTVNLPHTWNAKDVMDDVPGYYRGVGFYRKKLSIPSIYRHKSVSLYFEGANQKVKVFLNGRAVGTHTGGYTGFNIPLSGLKFSGSDEIMVQVDNSFDNDVPPLTADFTFFGGLYRSVSLIISEPAHFSDRSFGSSGVFINGANVNKSKADIYINGNFYNNGFDKQFFVVSILTNAKGKVIGRSTMKTKGGNIGNIAFRLPKIDVSNPTLWSPDHPYLYRCTTRLLDAKSLAILDEVVTPIGLRFFRFDVNDGFFLNDQPCKLIGTSRHQDFAGLGNAVSKKLQVKDIKMIKDMGGNFLRVAHYPQDQAVLNACDSLGILTSVEIPIVNEISESKAFTSNAKKMLLEMIKQNYNHTSIIIWAYMNEVLLKMHYTNDAENKKKYLERVANLARELEEITRSTDPTRYTMMSNHGDVNGYIKAGLTKIPMLVGWNLYQGWYGGKAEDFGPNLDKIHQLLPEKPILVTEYGADVDPRIHAFNPLRFDKSLEYGMHYHQIYIEALLKRKFVAGAAVWNLADFNSESREESMPHINNKGLLTIDRKPKNTYYLYKAYFQRSPFLKIGNGSWAHRSGIAKKGENHVSQMVQVLSNTDTVELFANGKSLGKKVVVDRITNWDFPFKDKTNELRAVSIVNGRKLEDVVKINFNLIPFSFKSGELNLLMGSERQFVDNQNKVWLPSKVYESGSWGSIGGEPFKAKANARLPYGTDKNIVGTQNDPIYQTQLLGLEGYQFDVPVGTYEIIFYFADLTGAGSSGLPYNLDGSVTKSTEIPQHSIFNVFVNGALVLKDFNLSDTFGFATAVHRKFKCTVLDDHGIRILFQSTSGKAVLNAMQIKRAE
ncbi:glycoside hydrolase family 2 TIM barrel-domain containing protein [Pedobacter sandarakinus]|uniref:glycoside hydrolase family 2 TIM barrel-domain containing protein n=1 Tax=Pedobacter sandarakinus TaxID=353156 RepID=UPI002247DC33|nr:glycoside hydrolase family 2 TIM barrel-domain containing protein [Pedobacter sandarakinus]MCX2574166.1 malectin domain-containing carbohydrate-binding protein [Pedobacter sandarakinus]